MVFKSFMEDPFLEAYLSGVLTLGVSSWEVTFPLEEGPSLASFHLVGASFLASFQAFHLIPSFHLSLGVLEGP